MPRKPRKWYRGAKYHITSRGVRKSSLFYDDQDRYKYLELLTEAKERFPFLLYTFCLMTNHIHLQIETIDHSPSDIMKLLHTKYAKYFNKRYDFSGHVFESRFGAELIESLEYEIEVNKYIHLNPLRAKIVDRLSEYPWSSYPFYLKGDDHPLVATSYILSYFSDPPIKSYHEYIQSPYCYLYLLPNGKLVYQPKEKQLIQEFIGSSNLLVRKNVVGNKRDSVFLSRRMNDSC